MNTKTLKNIIKLAIVLTCIVTMSSNVIATDWTKFHADPYNTGVTPDKAPIDKDLLTLWDVSTASSAMAGIDAEPVIVGDTIYVIGDKGTLLAIDKNDGTVLWTSKTNHGSDSWSLGAPCYGNGKIFVTTNNGMIYTFDAETGVELWNDTAISDNPNFTQMNTPVTYENGRIYFGGWLPFGGASQYYCYDEDGTRIWNRESTSGGYYRAGCVILGDHLIFGDENANLTSVYKSNGTTVDELDVSAEFNIDALRIRSAVTYDEDSERIYAATEGGYCVALGMNEDGTFNRSDKLLSAQVANKFTTTPAIYNGRLYVGTGDSYTDGTFYCLDASDLTEIWSFYIPEGGVQGSAAISTYYDDGDGEVYVYFTVNDYNCKLYCLKDWPSNMEMLSEEWYFQPEEEKLQFSLPGPIISEGSVYFANDAGYLFGISEKEGNPSIEPVMEDEWHQFQKDAQHTGFTNSDAPDTNTLLWESIDIDATTASSPVVADGKLYINCADWVKILDMYTGEYLGATQVPGNNLLDSWTPVSYNEGRVWCGHSRGINGGTLIANGKYYHGDYEGNKYYCYDESNDVELWSFTVEGMAQSTPAYSDGNIYLTGCVYENGGNVYCVDAETGNQVWSIEVANDPCGSFSVQGDIAYFTTYNWYTSGDIYALDKNTGEILWTKVIQRTDAVPTIAYGNVYVSSGCYSVSELQTYCFNATTGEEIWNVTGVGDWKCSAVVADGKVFVGKPDSFYTYASMYALNAFDGTEMWHYGRGGSAAAISDGIVFTVGRSGKVYAYAETAPDLETSAIVQSQVSAGQSNDITVQIANHGNVDAGSFEVTMLVDGVTLDTRTVTSLSKASNTEVTFEWTPEAEGEYELQVAMDTQNSIDERDEANNYFISTATTAIEDWNPWNDPDSEGLPDGTYITLTEVIDAYNCFRNGEPAPETGASIDLTRVIDLYNAFRYTTAM
ncbi:outer membrane protein assembly factor BamB family protein [Methanococcoides methylutens]|uniref:outer membrane protein assembly factor BamB family protein n=1 Tax=Methanococcoides methylutens TaxID=2226 RepID=UPI00069483BF|nr:PQQ-binding-like beta-propeller repeat protein [Methanococcoides methylutens]